MNARTLFFLLALLWLAGCNLPVAPPNPGLPAPSESNITLITANGTPTKTPFQPSVPTATIRPPLPPTRTSPPPLATAIPSFGQWPPPNSLVSGYPPVIAVPPPYPVVSDENTVNFLLIGSDRRTTSFRTDTLVIISIRPRDHLVTMISIPRDLFIYIPGWTMNRINTAYQEGELIKYPGGGAALLKDTILYNLGIKIDHTAMVEFNGFAQIVNTLGGIDLPLACPFTDWHIINPGRSDQDPNNWKLYTVGPGVIHMDGDLALWYARSRMRSSDFDRGRRQQEVLRAIYTHSMKIGVIPQIPKLYNDLRETVVTDLSLDTILQLVPLATDLGSARIRSFYINTHYVSSWWTPAGASVQLPKHSELQAMLKEAMAPPDPNEIANLGATIEIWNGTTHPDWDVLAAERLHYAGFITSLAPADQCNGVGCANTTQTLLYDFTADQDPAQSSAILLALGLPASSLVNRPDPKGAQDYRLIIGADYNPCFNPANLSH